MPIATANSTVIPLVTTTAGANKCGGSRSSAGALAGSYASSIRSACGANFAASPAAGLWTVMLASLAEMYLFFRNLVGTNALWFLTRGTRAPRCRECLLRIRDAGDAGFERDVSFPKRGALLSRSSLREVRISSASLAQRGDRSKRGSRRPASRSARGGTLHRRKAFTARKAFWDADHSASRGRLGESLGLASSGLVNPHRWECRVPHRRCPRSMHTSIERRNFCAAWMRPRSTTTR
jgi:hypothetical protein